MRGALIGAVGLILVGLAFNSVSRGHLSKPQRMEGSDAVVDTMRKCLDEGGDQALIYRQCWNRAELKAKHKGAL